MYSSRLALIAAVLAVAAAACGDTTAATTTPGSATTAATTAPTTTSEAPGTTTTTESPTPDPIKRARIEVATPLGGDEVSSPLTVSGMSNTFEATVYYRLTADGAVLSEGFTMGGTGDWAPFEAVIEFDNACCTELLLEVFEISAADGSEKSLVSIPLSVAATG